jgi:ectoine hydroxylase-related dioxygenase (phytanoyl-CoA dioxygenase family)
MRTDPYLTVSVTSFDRDGFAVLPRVLDGAACDDLAGATEALSSGLPGTRNLLAHGWCADLARRLRAHPDIASLIPVSHVAVQCTYFEKSAEQNWLVPVHQDLSIPVRHRVEHPALRGWSEKEGSVFVQAPVEVLEQLVAVRVHIDACGEADGPLQFVPRTHTRGRIDAAQASALKREGPVVTCGVERGGVLLMRPLALHASSKATGTSRRRVLHLVFGPAALPYRLEWERSVA